MCGTTPVRHRPHGMLDRSNYRRVVWIVSSVVGDPCATSPGLLRVYPPGVRMATPRPCSSCGTPTVGTRCRSCQAQADRTRNRARTHYHGDWRTVARTVVDAWVERHGLTCPGWDTPPHPVPTRRALCCDHVEGGTRAAGLAVLCRSCNSRKGATVDKQARTQGGTPTTA